jgi:hypothetical protein
MHAMLASVASVHAFPVLHSFFSIVSHVIVHVMDVWPPIWD